MGFEDMKDINGTFSLKDQEFALLVKRFGHSHTTPLHNHDGFEIVYVERGFSMHSVDGITSLLIPGDILILAPWTYHEYWKSINNFVYNCIFYTDILESDLPYLSELPLLDMLLSISQTSGGNQENRCMTLHVNPLIRQEALSLLKAMEKEIETRLDGWKIKAKALLVEFLILLSRSYTGNIKSAAERKSGYAQPIFEILRMLESSAGQKISIEQIAHRAGFTSEHFSRTFKKITGLPPSTYILTMKIADAAEKLMTTGDSVSQIAESVGFTDLNYFSRVFKQETGKSPSDFRKMV